MSITDLTHLWIQLLLRGVLRQQTEIYEPKKGANQQSNCGVLDVYIYMDGVKAVHVFRSTIKRDTVSTIQIARLHVSSQSPCSPACLEL